MILISACLAGVNCKYSGGNNEVREIRELMEQGKAIAVCPEQLGGLSTPRASSELLNGRVINTAGEDVTAQFQKGAELALDICRKNCCTMAILKSYSPSCGCNGVYDGTFSHHAIDGKGCFAKRLSDEGIECCTAEEYIKEIKK
ncbi:MAG: DUF523 domain-containing protein [Erysipelotrichia bacterium]|nr:DUF523 domain-containing protein [Erysipelotrichia bacterium]